MRYNSQSLSEGKSIPLCLHVDYLTKWIEVFAAPDHSALTIAKLLFTDIISRHGVPRELLSDRGAGCCYRRYTG